ncbi:MAG: hypothetical protein ABUL49_01575 [bacterium]
MVLRITGVHDDEGKPVRNVFGTVWLVIAIIGAVVFFSGGTFKEVTFEATSLNFAIGFLLPLAIGIMFYRSMRNGMVILLVLAAYMPCRSLWETYQATRTGHPIPPTVIFSALFVAFAFLSAFACNSSCGPRFTKVAEE